MLDTEWVKILRNNPEGTELIHALECIDKNAEPLLERIIELFPDFTEHDIKHSRRVIKNLKKIIPNSLKKRLNVYEIYFLIASSYLHDVGMVNFPELIGEQNFSNVLELRHHIRENHHLRSETFILKNFKDLGIADEFQARIIGKLSRGHRKENLTDQRIFKSDVIYRDYPINVPLLSSFLRIADELDLTFERIPALIWEHIPPENEISKKEWRKLLTISGVSVHPVDPLLVKCSAVCKDPDIHRALKRLETKINFQLSDLPRHLHHYREFTKDLPRKFFIDIETEGYKAYDFKFTLQERQILELLMGEKLYKRKEESLRELLKNSVDSCRAKREKLKKLGTLFTPKITFDLNPVSKQLTVTDNGFGMDQDIVERYFTRIGESFYSSTEFMDENLDFTPVSELGIGILSCFMIAEKMLIDTKTQDSNSLQIEIDNISEYFFVREGNRQDVGTSVTLFLRDEILKEIDLEKEIRYYARHLEFPIQIKLGSKGKIMVEDVGFSPEIYRKSLVNIRKAAHYDYYTIELNTPYVEGIISFLFEKDSTLGLKPAIKRFYAASKQEHIFLSNEGIFVEHFNVLPEVFDHYHIFTDLNLKKSIVDLNVARNLVVKNEKLKKFQKDLEKIIFTNLNSFLNNIIEKGREEKINYISLCRGFFNNYLEWIDEISKLKENNMLSDIFINFTKKFCYYKTLSKNGITYGNYNTLTRSNKRIIKLYWHDCDNDHVKEIFSRCKCFDDDVIYILYEWPFTDFLDMLSGDFIQESSVWAFLNMKRSKKLTGLVPQSWKLVKFESYKTKRFFESLYPTLVSVDNRFVKLLIENVDYLMSERKMLILGFFRSLKRDLRSSLSKAQANQKEILRVFIADQIIRADEVSYYLFKKEDFPPYLT